LLTLILAASLAADMRPVAVLPTSKRGGADAYTQKMAERVHAALTRESVPGLLSLEEGTGRLKAAGISDPRTCQAAKPCVGKLALILGEKGVVVSVDTAKAGSVLAILVEAISGDGTRVLATTELTIPVAKEGEDLALPIVLFARELKEKLEAEAPKEVVKVEPDAPVKKDIEPPLPTPPLVVIEKQASARKPVGGVFAGVAAAGAVTTVVLAIVSGTAKGEFDRSIEAENESNLPLSKLKDLEGRANGGAAGAIVSGGVAVVAGVIAVVLLAGK
jgi:hypothetical protein